MPRNRFALIWLAALTLLCLASPEIAFALDAKDALTQALRETHADGVVLDLKAGKVTARVGREVRATPGSAIKPLLLEYALEHDIITSGTQVFCDRHLHIANRSLDCSHPRDRNVFNAESALAESCNGYFAELGRRYTGPQLEQALRETRLQHQGLSHASAEERELTALGLEDITATPLSLAQAYRELILRLAPGSSVERGLKESIDYGMAHPAAAEGMAILGKTGTARNPGETWTHGWFAGALPGQLVIVIYVPHGDGGTAAALARQFFLAMRNTEAR